MKPADERQLHTEEGAQLTGSAASTEQWFRVKEIFLEALDHPEAERLAHVADVCRGDAALENEIISLLSSEKAAGAFCETPAAELLNFDGSIDAGPSPRLAAGTRLGPYELTSFVAAGGMGEVYRARHTLLARQAAIKTVRTGSVGWTAKRRLLAEARHASDLNHPNICTIYEVGEERGIPFIAMEFVDGRQLKEMIRSAIPSLNEALAFGIQIADALEHAHRKGLVHRDLKSSNIVVDNNGRPIVLDFGLSKRLPGMGGERMVESTATASPLAGTLSHMAPEVLRGQSADVRSDVWSLGVLLYELVTGRLPFQGPTSFETGRRIMSRPAVPIGHHVPLPLRLVIERCLVKNPKGRYQTAAEVRDALVSIRHHHAWRMAGRLMLWARRRMLYSAALASLLAAALLVGVVYLRERLSVTFGQSVSSLAIMPFENATGDPAADYYAQGFTRALTEQLGSMSRIRIVIQPAESGAGGGSDGVGGRGTADARLEGRLVKMGDRVGIDARLIDEASGRVEWSDAFERSGQQVLALQADLIRALAAQINLSLREKHAQGAATVRAVNPEAYEEYLKGRYEWNKRTTPALQAAIGHFRRAIELDPTYAPAHAAIADCYNQFGTLMVGMGSPLVYRPLAIAEAIAALQIDPYSAEAHAALGYAHHYNWQWDDAEREFRTAISLNPSFPLAHVWYANLLMSRNRLDEGLEHVYAARALDPYSLIVNTNVGWLLSAAGRSADALRQLEWTIQLDSTYTQARWRLIGALVQEGRTGDAELHAERLVELSDSTSPSLAVLAGMRFRMGRIEATRAILSTLLERAEREYVVPASVAGIYAMLGDTDKQLEWATRSFRERSNLVAYNHFDSGVWKSDPRFVNLVERSGVLRGRDGPGPPAQQKGTDPGQSGR
ncbi:MAG: protein kinase domain-containing protein [Gemmatimonadaceae bacterium]